MSANVSIITNEVKDALTVPSVALKFSPTEKQYQGKKYEKQGVWILTKTGIKRYDIEVGATDDTKVQIINSEIKEKDKVIVGIKGQMNGKNSSSKSGGKPMPF